MGVPRLSTPRVVFLVAVPIAWAVLLLFHPGPDPGDMYGDLRDQATRWLVVHVGTLVFIGLVGYALHDLMRDLPGGAARISRAAAWAFVVFYGAAEAIIGVAVGVLVRYANGRPEAERGPIAGAIQALWDDVLVAEVIATLGAVAWAVAALAAAVAMRRAGAPLAVSILLALATMVLLHAPPIGPVGLLCLAAAVVVLAVSQRRRVGASSAARSSADRPDGGAR